MTTPQPLTAEEIADHRPVTYPDDVILGREWCEEDAQLWPCQVARLDAMLMMLRRDLERLGDDLDTEAGRAEPDRRTFSEYADRLRAVWNAALLATPAEGALVTAAEDAEFALNLAVNAYIDDRSWLDTAVTALANLTIALRAAQGEPQEGES